MAPAADPGVRLLFVRHGESEANVAHVFSNRGRKHPLTARGREQAAALAERLRARPVARVYTSPLLRAVETACSVAAALGLEAVETDALREFDCGFEDRGDEASWALFLEFMQALVDGRRLDERIEQGESYHDMQARFVPFVRGLAAELGGTPAEVVLVGHGALFILMLPLVLANVDVAFALEHGMPNTCVIAAEDDAGSLRCVQWGESEVTG
jgi:broad specificity phosphatase PhoE